jgi:hypothetical protein
MKIVTTIRTISWAQMIHPKVPVTTKQSQEEQPLDALIRDRIALIDE